MLGRQGELLAPAFALGDSDPRWPFGPGAEIALRLQRCLETVSTAWALPTDSISVIADRYLAFYLAIMGSIAGTSVSTISYSPIEKKEILAIIDGLPSTIERKEFRVGLDGLFDYHVADHSLAILQLRNGETGICQRSLPKGALIIDATSALPSDLKRFALDSRSWQSIILDATSWGGPRGVYYLAINPSARWKNPLPTLDTVMPRFSANYGLTLLAALQLEDFATTDQAIILQANQQVREIVSTVADVDIAGSETGDRLSISFLYVQSEELQRVLFTEGFLFDSGSACSSSSLEPSHVLARMGVLSQGNVRLRLRVENAAQAPALARALVAAVAKIR